MLTDKESLHNTAEVAHIGTTNRTISRQRLGDRMLWTGLVVAGISMWSFGLFYMYSSLGAATPQPSQTATIALASLAAGILLSLGGLVLLRGMPQDNMNREGLPRQTPKKRKQPAPVYPVSGFGIAKKSGE